MNNLNIKSEEQQLKDVAIANTPTIGAQYLTEINQAADASALPRPILYGFLEHKSGFDVQRQSTEDSVGLSGLPLQTIKNYAPEAESYGLDTDEDPLDRADSEVRTQARVAAQLLSNSYGNTSVMDNGQINDNVLRDTYEGVMRTAYGADYVAQDEDVNGFISAVKNYVNSGKEPEFKNADVVMKRNYDANYNTVLNEEDEAEFNNWFADAKSKGLIHPDDNGADYDWRGYWKDNQGELQGNYEAHFTDLYKKPNHPTITKGSIYYQQGYITDDDIGEFVDQSKVPELDKKGIPYIIEPDTGAVYVQPKARRNKEGVTGGAAPIDYGSTKGQGIPLGSVEMEAPEETGLLNYFGKISRSYANKLTKWNSQNAKNRQVETHPNRYFDNTSKYNENAALYDPFTGSYVLYGELKKVMYNSYQKQPVETTVAAMSEAGVGKQEIAELVYTMEEYKKAEQEEYDQEQLEAAQIAKEEAAAKFYGYITSFQANRGFMPNLLPEVTKQDILSSMNRAALNPEDVEVVNNFVDTFRSQVVDNSSCEVEALYKAESLKWGAGAGKDRRQLDDQTTAALVLATRFMYNKDNRIGRIFLESAITSGDKQEDPIASLETKEINKRLNKIRGAIPVLSNMDFSSRLQGSISIHPTDDMVRAIATATARDEKKSYLGGNIKIENNDIVNKVNDMYVTDSSTQLFLTRGQLPDRYMTKKHVRAFDAYMKRMAIQATKGADGGILDIYDKEMTPTQLEAIAKKLGVSKDIMMAEEVEQVRIRRAALRRYITQNKNEVLFPYTNGLSFSVALKLKDDYVTLSIDGEDPYGNPEKQPLSFPASQVALEAGKSSRRLEDTLTKYGRVIDFSKVPADVDTQALEAIVRLSNRYPKLLHRLKYKGITEAEAIQYRKKYVDTVLDGYMKLEEGYSKVDPRFEMATPEELFSSYIKAISDAETTVFGKLNPLESKLSLASLTTTPNSLRRGKIPEETINRIVQEEIDLFARRRGIILGSSEFAKSAGKMFSGFFANTIGWFFETVFPEKEDIGGD